MSKNVELKSIAYLLDKTYFIRMYQRGYRWDADQLEDLLNDFKEFIDTENKPEEEFYCLQPIVVKRLTQQEKGSSEYVLEKSISKEEINNKDIFEVIDGQQRLTTVNLILCYLENELENIRISCFPKIIYEIRPDSSTYLEKFRKKSSFEDLRKEAYNNIDFYHMHLIYRAVENWFHENESYKVSILNLLTSYRINNVRIIWYEVNEHEDAIAVFRRFNIGKIPLNNAELIKAILLKDDKNKQHAEKYIISQQWEKIENRFQDLYFWSFLNPKKEYNSRIEYIFDLIFEIEAGIKEEEKEEQNIYGSDKFKVFRYFDKLVKNNSGDLLKVWDKVSDIYEELNQYYNHPSHYHYIGYLNNQESETGKFKITELIRTIKSKESPIKDKASLSAHLLRLVKSATKHFFRESSIALNYESQKKHLRDFFLLLNVEITRSLNKSIGAEFAHRYSFNKHKQTSFDIEHIGSQTDREPKNDLEKIDYLRDFYTDYYEDIEESVKNGIESLWKDNSISDKVKIWELENIDLKLLSLEFLTIQDSIKKMIDEQDKLEDKDNIGNLALLNSDINRSYGNAFFPTKRRLLIEADMAGTFIPLGTKNVFLKYYSKDVNKHTRWTQKDIESYSKFLLELLKDYR